MSTCKGYVPHTITLSYPITDLDRPLGLQEVEASRISWRSAHEGGKVVSHMPSHTTSKRRRIGWKQHVAASTVFTSIYCLILSLSLSLFIYIYIYIYRVSQEERTKLREGVPYVKLYRYNPKHLYTKLNGYWDNGQIKLWTSFGSTNDTCQLGTLIYIKLLTLAWNTYPCICQAGSHRSRVTSPLSIPVWCIVLRTLCIITRVLVFL